MTQLDTDSQETQYTGFEIAVIGMAGKFPSADNIDEFWDNLKNGVESISFLTIPELKETGVPEEIYQDDRFVKAAGGVVSNKDCFDARFFGYTPQEAELLNPQTRVFYQVTWEALEHAGYNPFDSQNVIGVYAGADNGFSWKAKSLLTGKSAVYGNLSSSLLTEENYLCSRVAYHLNLKGPAVAIQTACSTSLVAVHVGCQALLNGECDIALAGGVNIYGDPYNGYPYQEGMISSPDGHCRAFDSRSGGVVGGEGAGIVVMKQLEKAIQDGDTIHAIIKSTAVNNDGIRKVGYTAPSVEGQAEVIEVAHNIADVDPGTIGYVETHGTATAMGDPVEIRALTRAFDTDETQYCALGSVKTNIGHLGSAAGIAGFIKTVLALKHAMIPPSIHFESPNPMIEFENSPFFVNPHLKQWQSEYPRRAGVSSFGIGGTNAHVVLEEAPERSISSNLETNGANPRLLLLSARSENALSQQLTNMKEFLNECPPEDFDSAAYTLQVGRKHFPYRRMCVASTPGEAVQMMSDPESGKVPKALVQDDNPFIIYMFPGLGSEYVNMGRELYKEEPVFREEMDRCFHLLTPLTEDLHLDVKTLLYPPDEKDNSPINHPYYSQIVIFIFQYSLCKYLEHIGLKPEVMIGYSFGEYTAACLSGVFSLEDALRLIVCRGRLMETLAPGALLSVPIPASELLTFLPKQLSLAIDNGPSCLVSGLVEDIEAFEKGLKQRRILSIRLPNPRAAHSHMMEPILDDYEAALNKVTLNPPRIPFIANVTGREITEKEATDPKYWVNHIRKTVLFADGMSKLVKAPSAFFVEIGPGNDLTAMVGRYLDNSEDRRHSHPPVVNLIKPAQKNISDRYYLMTKIGWMWLTGIEFKWRNLYHHDSLFRIPLPTYPFEKQKYTLDDSNTHSKPSSVSLSSTPSKKKREFPDWFYVPSWLSAPLLPKVEQKENRKKKCLVFASSQKESSSFEEALIQHLRQEHESVCIVRKGDSFSCSGSHNNSREFTIPSEDETAYISLFKELRQTNEIPHRIIHLWATHETLSNNGNYENLLNSGFFSLISIAKAIGSQNVPHVVQITVISCGLQQVDGLEPVNPYNALLLGPIKVIPQEHANIRCHSIDISSSEISEDRSLRLAERIHREILFSSDIVVAYRKGKRWLQVYTPFPLTKAFDNGAPLKEKGIYLITGGLGTIGNEIAKFLASHYHARLVLTGYHPLPPEDQWEQWLSEKGEKEPVSQKIRNIKEIRNLGADVIALQADVADKEQMTSLIETVENKWGPIDGVIHNAGLIEGPSFRLAHQLTKEQARLQFQAKINGTVIIHELFKERELDFCWLMSSICTALGGLTFSAYAAANMFLDAYVKNCNISGNTHWVSVDWDHLDASDTSTAFKRILACPDVDQFVISSTGDLHQRIRQWIELEHREEETGKDQDKSQSVLNLHPRPQLMTTYEPPTNQLEVSIAETWKLILGFDKIGIHDDFMELGGDSLKAITLIAQMQKVLKKNISLPLFFSNPTIYRLALALEKENIRESDFNPLEKAEEKPYYTMSAAQKRLFILHQVDKESLAYNEVQAVTLTGDVDIDKLENTFRQLIMRHEVFRTSFALIEELPVQMVHPENEVNFTLERFNSKGVIHEFLRPFDLSKVPLLRAGIVDTGKDSPPILMIDKHHIVTDGISHELFVSELQALYNGETLPAVEFQYRDFVQWQQLPEQQQALKKQEQYWLNHFSGKIPQLNLPLDRARPQVQRFEGHTVGFQLEPPVVQQLKELAAKLEITVFNVLLGIYNIFLSKISGQEDIIVGTGVSGRRHPDLQEIMGIFVNTLALRNFPAKEKKVGDFLMEIKNRSLEAFENQDYPFEDLVQKVVEKRDTSRNPLFDTMFQLQERKFISTPHSITNRSRTGSNAEVKVSPYRFDQGIAKFDLTLFAQEGDDGFHFSFEYSTTLFNSETIDRFILYFKEILLEAISTPECTIDRIIKMPESRTKALLENIRTQETQVPGTILEELNQSFANYPTHTAIQQGEVRVDYAQLNKVSDEIATFLKTQRIPHKTPVAVLLKDRKDIIPVMIGLIKAQCLFVPMEESYPFQRLQAMMDKVGISYMITHPHTAAQPEWQERFPGNSTVISQSMPQVFGELLLMQTKHPEDKAQDYDYKVGDSLYIYFTSGTTGTPRAMLGSDKSLLHFIRWEIDTFDIDENSRISQLTTPVFDAYLRDILTPLCSGGTVCLPPDIEIIRDPQRLGLWLEKSEITLIHCVPGVFRLLASPDHLETGRFPVLKYILLSGEPVYPSDLGHWFDMIGTRIQLVNLWGTSETTLAKTFHFIIPGDTLKERVPVGLPLPGANVLALNENLEPCDTYVTGELYIQTPYRTLGYVKDPETNSQRFIKTAFGTLHRTGDIGRIGHKNRIDVLGRNDRQVKIRGIRVELEEIEHHVVSHPSVSEAAALLKEIAEGNSLLCVYFTTPGSDKEVVDSVCRELTSRLPDYMVADRWIKLDQMPRKANGKIDYAALPEPLLIDSNTYDTTPSDEIEEKLHELWTTILGLGIGAIGMDAVFFTLGGNSLNVMTLITRIHKTFEIRLTLAEIFNNPTIRKQAQCIREKKDASDVQLQKYIPIQTIQEQPYYDTTYAQQRVWGLSRDTDASIAFNMPQAYVIHGDLDIQAFDSTFHALIQRHESLRTVFTVKDNALKQKILSPTESGFSLTVVDFREYEEVVWKDKIKTVAREVANTPFILETGPLLSATLIRLPGDKKFAFIFNMHHIIGDMVSNDIMMREIVTLYQGFKESRPNPLPPLKFHYKDYASWLNNQLNGHHLERHLSYWHRQFETLPEPLELPLDFPRPQQQTFNGEEHFFTASNQLSGAIREIGESHDTTLFMTLTAALAILLFRYSGQEDIVIGTPAAGREHADLENQIGFYLNTLALRFRFTKTDSFLQLLQHVKSVTTGAFDHQIYPFDKLVKELLPVRDPSRHPLFDVMMDLTNFKESEVENIDTGLTLIPMETGYKRCKFDLTLYVSEGKDTISFRIEYNRDLFKEKTILRMASRYVQLLTQITNNLNSPIDDLKLEETVRSRMPSIGHRNRTRK